MIIKCFFIFYFQKLKIKNKCIIKRHLKQLFDDDHEQPEGFDFQDQKKKVRYFKKSLYELKAIT